MALFKRGNIWHAYVSIDGTRYHKSTGTSNRRQAEAIHYYHDDRTHLGLNKQTPAGRKSATSTTTGAKIISMPRLGGLHHHYNLAA